MRINQSYEKYDLLKDEAYTPADEFVDPAYPDIRVGVKFTPIRRGYEYSVLTVTDARPNGNMIKADAVMYSWCGGHYARLNKTPVECEMDRAALCKTHSPACQGRKKAFNWRRG